QRGRRAREEPGHTPLAAAPADRARLARPGTRHQSDRAALDAVRRDVLPDGAGSSRAAHQRLPGALAPTEVSATPADQEGPGLLATHHPSAAAAVCPLGMDGRVLVTKTTRAG